MRALSILVVDDVPAIQTLLTEWLTTAGHTVAAFGTGEDAIRYLEAHDVDLVITDVLMPEGDGLDVIGATIRHQPSARIVAISGGGRHMTAGLCVKIADGFGAHAALGKPFDRDQLFHAVGLAFQPRDDGVAGPRHRPKSL